MSRYQKGKTNLDFTEARDSEWQWHQLGHMQVCITIQTDNHASTPPLFLPSVFRHCWLCGRKGIRPVKRVFWTWNASKSSPFSAGAPPQTPLLPDVPVHWGGEYLSPFTFPPNTRRLNVWSSFLHYDHVATLTVTSKYNNGKQASMHTGLNHILHNPHHTTDTEQPAKYVDDLD